MNVVDNKAFIKYDSSDTANLINCVKIVFYFFHNIENVTQAGSPICFRYQIIVLIMTGDMLAKYIN